MAFDPHTRTGSDIAERENPGTLELWNSGMISFSSLKHSWKRKVSITDCTVRFNPSSLQNLFYDKGLTIVEQEEEKEKEKEKELGRWGSQSAPMMLSTMSDKKWNRQKRIFLKRLSK